MHRGPGGSCHHARDRRSHATNCLRSREGSVPRVVWPRVLSPPSSASHSEGTMLRQIGTIVTCLFLFSCYGESDSQTRNPIVQVIGPGSDGGGDGSGTDS